MSNETTCYSSGLQIYFLDSSSWQQWSRDLIHLGGVLLLSVMRSNLHAFKTFWVILTYNILAPIIIQEPWFQMCFRIITYKILFEKNVLIVKKKLNPMLHWPIWNVVLLSVTCIIFSRKYLWWYNYILIFLLPNDILIILLYLKIIINNIKCY